MTESHQQQDRRRRVLAASFLFFVCVLVAKETFDVEEDGWTIVLSTTGVRTTKTISTTPITQQASPRRPEVDWNNISCPGNTEPWHDCNLQEFYYGYPVILISFGRSGSTVTWDTMTALASPRRGQKSAESTGRNTHFSLQPLREMDPAEHGKCWMQRILCHHQQENRILTKAGKGKSKLIGTKWKPYLKAFNHTKSREALEWIAATPWIKVVYSERNPLDITISRYKHNAYEVPAHCFDERCKREHETHDKDLMLPFDFLWGSMTNLTQDTATVKGILDELGVGRVEVSYERLYYANHTREWMKIFRHLDVGPRFNLTKAEVLSRIEHVETHPTAREDAIGNYHAVEAALNETEFAKYLIPVTELTDQED